MFDRKIGGVLFTFSSGTANEKWDPTEFEKWEFDLQSGHHVCIMFCFGIVEVLVNNKRLGFFRFDDCYNEKDKISNRKARANFAWMFRSLSGVPLEHVERVYNKVMYRCFW